MYNSTAFDYLPILIFIVLAFSIGTLLVLLPFALAKRLPYKAKNAQYECGFQAFGELRSKFDIRFYIIAILFIIFDLEVAFLFPWAIVLKRAGWMAFSSMVLFLAILLVGFIYEWLKGALEWQ